METELNRKITAKLTEDVTQSIFDMPVYRTFRNWDKASKWVKKMLETKRYIWVGSSNLFGGFLEDTKTGDCILFT